MDEAKRKADMEKDFKETINKATSILRLAKRRPDLWGKPKIQELRALTHDVAGDPNLFPPTKDNKGCGFRIDQLTKGIGILAQKN